MKCPGIFEDVILGYPQCQGSTNNIVNTPYRMYLKWPFWGFEHAIHIITYPLTILCNIHRRDYKGEQKMFCASLSAQRYNFCIWEGMSVTRPGLTVD